MRMSRQRECGLRGPASPPSRTPPTGQPPEDDPAVEHDRLDPRLALPAGVQLRDQEVRHVVPRHLGDQEADQGG